MKTGNTGRLGTSFDNSTLPQWSPVMKTGNTSTTAPPPNTQNCLNGARS